MPTDYKERAFEAAVEHHLAMHGGYTHGDHREYDALGSDPAKSPLGCDRESAMFPGVFIAFVKATQPDTKDQTGQSRLPSSSECSLVGQNSPVTEPIRIVTVP